MFRTLVQSLVARVENAKGVVKSDVGDGMMSFGCW